MYYLDGRREEVVTYSAPLDTFGNKLGAIARKRGLSEAEKEAYRNSMKSLCSQILQTSQQSLNKNRQEARNHRGLTEAEEEVYRSSLGSLCSMIKNASQQSLNKNQQVIVDVNEQPPSSQRAPSRSRKDSTPDIEKVRHSFILIYIVISQSKYSISKKCVKGIKLVYLKVRILMNLYHKAT